MASLKDPKDLVLLIIFLNLFVRFKFFVDCLKFKLNSNTRFKLKYFFNQEFFFRNYIGLSRPDERFRTMSNQKTSTRKIICSKENIYKMVQLIFKQCNFTLFVIIERKFFKFYLHYLARHGNKRYIQRLGRRKAFS